MSMSKEDWEKVRQHYINMFDGLDFPIESITTLRNLRQDGQILNVPLYALSQIKHLILLQDQLKCTVKSL